MTTRQNVEEKKFLPFYRPVGYFIHLFRYHSPSLRYVAYMDMLNVNTAVSCHQQAARTPG
jgi:hypothetical protein